MKRLPVITERALAEVKALQIQTAYDYELKLRLDETPITCKKGCTSCCYHPFLITIAEGVLLYRALYARRKWTAALKRQLIETRDKVLGLSFEIWLLSNIPCPMLDAKGSCYAYEDRPLRCRTSFSMGDPSLCRPNELGPKTPMTPNADAVIDFSRSSLAALKRAGVADSSLMPLAEAVLLGEAIETGKLDINEADRQHLKDLMNG